MARKEFTKATQRKALERSGYVCEAITPAGPRCPIKVGNGSPVEFHHIVADTMGGEPTLDNCAALCPRCHKIETALLAKVTSRAQRRADKHNGVTDPHRRELTGRGFGKAPPQNTCRVPAKGDMPPLPRRSLFTSA